MRKRILSLLLSVMLVLPLLPMAALPAAAVDTWDGSVDTAWYNNHTGDTEFSISTAEELAGLAQLVNNGNNLESKTVKLTDDLDLGNMSWTPIGIDNSHSFSGTFDGGYYKISGLSVNSSNNYQGLFGYVSGSGSEIKNLGVKGTVRSDVYTSSSQGSTYNGGIVGYLAVGKLVNCYFDGSVNVQVSPLDPPQSFAPYAGGVAGFMMGGRMESCYNTGSIANSSAGYAGGLVGFTSGGVVQDCYNTGSVTSIRYTTFAIPTAGGVAGYNTGGYLINCYSTATVTSMNSFSQNNFQVGGVTGLGYNTGAAGTNCFYLAGKVNGGNGGNNGKDEEGQTGIDRDAFALRSTFTGWDFDTVWARGIDGFPVLQSNPETLYYGEGGDADKIIIPNLVTLELFRDWVNGTGKYAGNTHTGKDISFKLTDSIDISAKCGVDGTSWKPIGTNSSLPFSGTFDGDDHTITGLYINSTGDYQGLFGYVTGSITNLRVVGAEVEEDQFSVSGSMLVGGIAGFASCTINDKIENCSFTGNVRGTGNSVGGVVGAQSLGSITNCFHEGSVVSGGQYIGGVLGQSLGGVSVNSCYHIGTVSSTGNYVGGVAGQFSSSSSLISNCYHIGTVNSTGNYVGGVLGYTNARISNCYNTGTVTGDGYVGGVAGWVVSAQISNCYNTGTVTGTDGVGGVAGYMSGRASNCYNTGAVIGDSYVGPVARSTDSQDCYYLKGACGCTAFEPEEGVTAITAAEFADKDTFVNWKIGEEDSPWVMGGSIRPVLKTPQEKNLTALTSPECECPDGTCECEDCACGEDADCRPHVHQWDTGWTSDGTGHWHKCTADGCDIEDYSDCGEDIAEFVDYGEHDYTEWVNDNATEHWKTCVCGAAGIKAAHDYTTWVTTDNDQHWKTCECGAEGVKASHAYTTWVSGDPPEHWQTCECGKESAKTAHDYTTWVSGDPTEHWQTCECGKESAKAAHDYTILVNSDPDEHWNACVCGKEGSHTEHSKTLYHTDAGHADECLTCGWKETDLTDHDKTFYHTDAGHANECLTCDWKETELTDHNKTLYHTEEGHAYKCQTCEWKETELTDHDPHWVNTNSAEHWEACDCGWESAKTAHEYDDNKDVDCNICGYVRTISSGSEPSTHPAEDEKEPAPCDGDEDCPSRAFADLDTARWYHESTDYVIENRLMVGVGGGKFRPNTTLSRGMMVQILYTLESKPEVTGSSDFTDVQEGAWYEKAVIWAAEHEIVAGYGNGTFGPNDPLTREQMAAMLHRYEKFHGGGDIGDLWLECAGISSYAYEAMTWCTANDIIRGYEDGSLKPKNPATRVETAAVLTRYCKLREKD